MLKRLSICFALLAFCMSAQAPGKYSGTWTSGVSGNAGKLMLSFAEADLNAASFTYQGQEVTTKPISFSKTGDQVEFVFEYSLDGNLLRSRMQGTAAAQKTLKGKYKSTTADGASPVDEGTWEVTPQQ